MKFTTKTEYGLLCLIYMANNTELHPVTIKQLVKSERYSLPFTEKILQRLRAAKIVSAQHGNQGGYILARSPSEITLKEIVEALEGYTFDVFCEPRIRDQIICNHFPLCGVKPVWERLKNIMDDFFGSVTLDELAKNTLKPVH